MAEGRERCVPYSVDRVYVSKKELQIMKKEHRKREDRNIKALKQKISNLGKDWDSLVKYVLFFLK